MDSSKYPKTWSVHGWTDDVNATEYSYFYEEYKEAFGNKEEFTYDEAINLCSFNYLFSSTRLPQPFIYVAEERFDEFKSTWFFEEPV